MIAWLLARPRALRIARWAALALAVAAFLAALRRSGERAGRAAERIEALERAIARERATRRRMDHADTGSGDADADREWLRFRSRRGP